MLNQSKFIVENFKLLKEKSKGITVLLVEDNPLIRAEYVTLFSKIFDKVDSRENGLDGLHAFLLHKYDFIITDVEMPVMNGLEMTRQIKKNHPSQPILLLSGHQDQAVLYESIQLGICGYLFKPFDMVQMLNTLNRLVTRITMERENLLYSERLEELVKKKSDEALAIYTIDGVTGLFSLARLQQDVLDTTYKSLAILKVKNFKAQNDFHGYDVGDSILKQTANIAQEYLFNHESLLEEVKIYRMGGSHFALLSNSNAKSLQILTENIIKIFESTEINVNHNLTYFEMNGAVVSRKKKLTLSDADTALRIASKLGKVIIYETNEDVLKTRALKLQCSDSIKRALLENRVVPFYHGILDNETKKIYKYEALARLIMPDGNIVAPGTFLPISKQTKTYNKITMAIIRKALLDFRDSECSLSLNLSIDDINDRRTREFVFEQIALFPEPSRLVFELLESENIGAYNEVKTFFSKIKAFGCKVAIDDFGSGYSNFEHIAKLDLDYIKIDGSLIVAIEHEVASRTIVEMLSAFAKKMKIKTIAEYVSSEAISDMVNAIGIHESQGYFFSQPSPYHDSMKIVQAV